MEHRDYKMATFHFLKIFFYMYLCFACMYVHDPHVCLVSGWVQKMMSDFPEQELEMVVSSQMGPGNQTWVPWNNSSQCPYPLDIFLN